MINPPASLVRHLRLVPEKSVTSGTAGGFSPTHGQTHVLESIVRSSALPDQGIICFCWYHTSKTTAISTDTAGNNQTVSKKRFNV